MRLSPGSPACTGAAPLWGCWLRLMRARGPLRRSSICGHLPETRRPSRPSLRSTRSPTNRCGPRTCRRSRGGSGRRELRWRRRATRSRTTWSLWWYTGAMPVRATITPTSATCSGRGRGPRPPSRPRRRGSCARLPPPTRRMKLRWLLQRRCWSSASAHAGSARGGGYWGWDASPWRPRHPLTPLSATPPPPPMRSFRSLPQPGGGTPSGPEVHASCRARLCSGRAAAPRTLRPHFGGRHRRAGSQTHRARLDSAVRVLPRVPSCLHCTGAVTHIHTALQVSALV